MSQTEPVTRETFEQRLRDYFASRNYSPKESSFRMWFDDYWEARKNHPPSLQPETALTCFIEWEMIGTIPPLNGESRKYTNNNHPPGFSQNPSHPLENKVRGQRRLNRRLK